MGRGGSPPEARAALRYGGGSKLAVAEKGSVAAPLLTSAVTGSHLANSVFDEWMLISLESEREAGKSKRAEFPGAPGFSITQPTSLEKQFERIVFGPACRRR